MSEYLRKLTDKFFNDDCTIEEAEKVLNWLETDEGQTYLDSTINEDADRRDQSQSSEPQLADSENIKSELIFLAILDQLKQGGYWNTFQIRRIPSLFYAAATVLVIITLTVFYFSNQADEMGQEAPIVITTSDTEQREIRLNDGTSITMNKGSLLRINPDYHQKERIVELEGEAFFDVISIPDKPFIIAMNGSTVEVLGTSFNIRNMEESNRIEVSVTDGLVVFRAQGKEGHSMVELQKGDYASWNKDTGDIQVEHFGVQNYIAWMSREFHFNEMSMNQVCIQLNRFYNLNCKFANSSIENHRLTAQFRVSDLNNTLSVIALSLNLDYQLEENVVVWRNSESG